MVTPGSYRDFFETVTGKPPYPYQERIVEGDWPDLLDVPTGLGKTAAIAVAWLWNRLTRPSETPRRLVYCLPMRTLVEQTYRVMEQWLSKSNQFVDPPDQKPTIHVLMGGADDIWSRDPDNDWYRWPERPSVLVGTQDMLLSRALMRGYAMSPYSWPIHYAFLHSDCLWVFDEVQLMGPAVATSAQLEAFRRQFPPPGRASRTLWSSATIARSWLETVDLKTFSKTFGVARLSAADEPMIQHRLDAEKRVARAATVLTDENSKKNAAAYSRSLIDELLVAHRPGRRTLLIVNTVSRAQALFRELKKRKHPAEVMLLHSRYRPPDRRRIEQRIREEPSDEGTILIATQVVEAGVDLSAATLFTEIAPWSSFVQRCGRCNRHGEIPGANVFWIDIELDGPTLSRPYQVTDVVAARARIEGLRSASPRELTSLSHASADDPPPRGKVLRRKDLLELFSTDSDLTGFMVDISDYVRDADERSVYVFWRKIPSQLLAPSEHRQDKNEICSAPVGEVRELLKQRSGEDGATHGWKWDPLSGVDGEGAWVAVRPNDVHPGLTLLMDASIGGYSAETGFDVEVDGPTDPIETPRTNKPEAYETDRGARLSRWVELASHSKHAQEVARSITDLLRVEKSLASAVTDSALWHDVGKAHPVFQRDLLRGVIEECEMRTKLWAKSGPIEERTRERNPAPRQARRRYFRHELASALMVLEHAPSEQRDLVAYLVAAHHGKVRTSLRSIPEEPRPHEITTRFARGVWEGDVLPSLSLDAIHVRETTVHLDVMDLGGGESGRSWTARVGDLLSEHGPFRLAWLEALVRIADWRASAGHNAGSDVKEGS